MQPGNPAFVNRINAPTSLFVNSGRGRVPPSWQETQSAQAYQDIYRLLT
jgi:DHA2 family multidrug resistance protein